MIVNNQRKQYHCVATVRQREGMSTARAAARLGVRQTEVERLEDEYVDLPVSVLYAWQRALDVPITELLADTGDGTPAGIWDRAKLLKVMKTVGSIQEVSEDPVVQRLVENLRNELINIMPELSDVKPWPRAGTPRKPHECIGRMAIDPYSDALVRYE